MTYTEWMHSMPNANRRYIDDASPEDWAKYDAEFEQWCFEGRQYNTSAKTGWEPTRMIVNDIHYDLDTAKSDIFLLQTNVDALRSNTNTDIARLRKGLKLSAISNILLAVAFILHVVSHWI